MLIGYPFFFRDDPAWFNQCELIDGRDQQWINAKTQELNSVLRQAASREGAEFVDLSETSAGHEICRADPPAFMHGIRGTAQRNGRDWESFHPTAFGHGLIANAIKETVSEAQPGLELTILPGGTLSHIYSVALATKEVSFVTRWPGSNVVMTLRTPSGRLIDRATSAADVSHRVGRTSESYTVSGPEPGAWTVELYGADVRPEGEPVRLLLSQRVAPNRVPLPVVHASQDGWKVAVDAAGTTDPDGDAISYTWDFDTTLLTGDPNAQNPTVTRTGQSASYTYTTPGVHSITLIARDAKGGAAFAFTQGVVTIQADSTAPTVTLTTPPAGASYTVGQHVTATFSCQDEPNGSGVATCDGTVPAGGNVDTATSGTKSFSVTTTDNAGHATTEVHNYTVGGSDTVAPVIAIASPSNNQTVARGQVVLASFACSDEAGGSGLATCVGTVANGVAIDTATLGVKTFSVTATDNGGNAATVSRTYTVRDSTNPTVTVTRPTANQVVSLGQSVLASYGCSDDPGGSGVASCVGTVANGVAISTTTAGPKTFAVTAIDNAGNQTAVTRSYTVAYNFTGFLQPVDNPPVLNTVNAGRAIPVKFKLGGNQGISIFQVGSPTVIRIDCASGAVLAEIEQTVTAGNSSLSYDTATATYNYVWKTNAAWAGTCQRLTVALNDGTTHTADFKFR